LGIETETFSLTAKLVDYGALGIFCVFLMGSLGYLIKAHREERREWKETICAQVHMQNELAQKVIEVTSEVKTLIQSSKIFNSK